MDCVVLCCVVCSLVHPLTINLWLFSSRWIYLTIQYFMCWYWFFSSDLCTNNFQYGMFNCVYNSILLLLTVCLAKDRRSQLGLYKLWKRPYCVLYYFLIVTLPETIRGMWIDGALHPSKDNSFEFSRRGTYRKHALNKSRVELVINIKLNHAQILLRVFVSLVYDNNFSIKYIHLKSLFFGKVNY